MSDFRPLWGGGGGGWGATLVFEQCSKKLQKRYGGASLASSYEVRTFCFLQVQIFLVGFSHRPLS